MCWRTNKKKNINIYIYMCSKYKRWEREKYYINVCSKWKWIFRRIEYDSWVSIVRARTGTENDRQMFDFSYLLDLWIWWRFPLLFFLERRMYYNRNAMFCLKMNNIHILQLTWDMRKNGNFFTAESTLWSYRFEYYISHNPELWDNIERSQKNMKRMQ